jgi:hypothetical protein
MKLPYVVIISLLPVIGLSQEVTIIQAGRTIKTKVKASSDTQLYTDAGNFKYAEMDSLITSDEGIKNKSYGKIGVTPIERMMPAFQSKDPRFIDDLPFNELGVLIYEEVVPCKGKKDDLYLRAKLFYADIFKSAKDVIQVDDKESGILVGKGLTHIMVSGEALFDTKMKMWFSIKIQCKDDRYKYELYDIHFESYPAQYVSEFNRTPTSLFLKAEYYRKNDTPKTKNSSYKLSMDASVKATLLVLKSRMERATNSTIKDDW